LWAQSAKQEANALLDKIVQQQDDASAVFQALKDSHEFHRKMLTAMGATVYATIDLAPGGDDHHTFQLEANEDQFIIKWPAVFGQRFFAAAMNVAQALRETDQEPGLADFLVRIQILVSLT
jgi:hypothetical protein